ncbi:MAG TPA: transglutaminase domain-containing protein [Candidatus Sulfotelmatobacter sp.]|nr:transglutaminase domain-containing protein [Candidatus Sulfotelmatobacter sp.]
MYRSRTVPVLVTMVLGLFVAFMVAEAEAYAQTHPPSRTFAFSYQVHVPATNDASGKFLLWLPLPQQNEFQKISDLRIDSPVAHSEGSDPEYHNPYVVFAPTPAQLEAGFEVTMHFLATRFEHKVDLASVSRSSVAGGATPPDLQRYLEPDKLVPLNGVIAELAKEHTAGDTTALEKARDIYDYVITTMRYDKSGEGWGRGDAVWACTSKRGNCTDFHSLFIGMMRASGIPARFEIGFPLPEGKSEGDIPGYHCWAEFYLQGTGWIPVDASEAWKNPAKRDYFFGAHDVNRVFFTYGRDIRLSPQQKGDPLNYFIYPYAELNGQPFKGLQTHFSFQDLAPAGVSAALR